jgi:coenzyme F420-reducing hydrogenase alpha subunit
MSGERRTIKVDYLARVEGEGGLLVKVRDGRVVETRLDIFEPPRFFEAFLRGRAFTEAPDITARICGICPVAYQMSAVQALEAGLGIAIDPQVRALRRLLYCGEWIESHVLHVTMLHAPDFLGYPDAVRMAADHREAVLRGLAVKKAGNAIVALLGGREIHPVNVRVGGFYRVPTRAELGPLAEQLRAARDQAYDMVRWVAGFDFPDFERDYEFVALVHPDEYPLAEGRIVSSRGLDVPAADYARHFVEEHVAHSNALQSRLRERGAYLCGPLARYALNAARLSPLARAAAREAGLGDVCRNPFRSIVVRAVEVLWACDEALRVIAAYEPPAAPAATVVPRAADCYGATEAPRGLLYHHYRLGADGVVLDATIVPPTSQNQRMVEEDLAAFVEPRLALPNDRLTAQCEQAVRNYDPCISCATHFLTVKVEEA